MNRIAEQVGKIYPGNMLLVGQKQIFVAGLLLVIASREDVVKAIWQCVPKWVVPSQLQQHIVSNYSHSRQDVTKA